MSKMPYDFRFISIRERNQTDHGPMRSISAQKEERSDDQQLDPMKDQDLKQSENDKKEIKEPVSILRKPSVIDYLSNLRPLSRNSNSDNSVSVSVGEPQQPLSPQTATSRQ